MFMMIINITRNLEYQCKLTMEPKIMLRDYIQTEKEFLEIIKIEIFFFPFYLSFLHSLTDYEQETFVTTFKKPYFTFK